MAANTLFTAGRSYGMFILDEAHYARTANKLSMACRELVFLCRMLVAMTATPIVTGPTVS